MSFYRTLVTAMAACVIAAPVLAANPANPANPATQAQQTITLAANAGTQQTATANAKINVNQAKAKDLLNVKGINPAMARSIISYRKKHGEFKSVNDLAKVRALKKLNADDLKAIQDQLTV